MTEHRNDDGADRDGTETLPNGETRRWWKEAVVYQIYPRSFNDSNGDGVGDLPGIVEKVDYLDDLGVDVVWLNPVYESPNADNGYDVADYRAIMDEFGTMTDWEELLAELHDRDIRLVMDLVANHTSDEHEWFRRSRRSRDDEYREWYFWREGRAAADVPWAAESGPDGEAPPNDWQSFFGGPAWTYDETTGEWYLHLFDEKQPDLDWTNERVRREIFDTMAWWLEKGIDGFRMDVINLISKPPGLPPIGDDPESDTFDRVSEGPRVHEFIREMRDAVLSPDLLTVGEMAGRSLSMEQARRYVGQGPDGDGLSMLFHFEHMHLDRGAKPWETEAWQLPELKAVFDRWQAGLEGEGWNALYLSNHDQPRTVSRFGDDGAYRRESATLFATLLHTLRGTPYVYQGQELGMTNAPFASLAEYRDVETIHPVRRAIDRGEIDSFEAVADGVRANSRDNARTPMQWTDGSNAGFTDPDVEPWIGINPNHEEINVADERDDPESVWHYYRRLMELREEHDVMIYGDYDPLVPDHERLWAYTRTLGEERWLVVLNVSGEPTEFELSADAVVDADPSVVISNYDCDRRETALAPGEGTFRLRPWEARVYEL
ncbi:glycoside hydrolase family 13 protein [Halobellus salinisoli]|uniref:glycoside hydrolase family 13 protein n=1 Tax=Halobellus salinisoli TaxID=3108500 RepID=UPI0030086AF3